MGKYDDHIFQRFEVEALRPEDEQEQWWAIGLPDYVDIWEARRGIEAKRPLYPKGTKFRIVKVDEVFSVMEEL